MSLKRAVADVIDISDDDGDAEPEPRKRILPAHLANLVRNAKMDVNGTGGDPRLVYTKRRRRAFVNPAPLAFEAYTNHTERFSDEIEMCMPRSQAEMDIDPRYHHVRSHGDEIRQRMYQALESFGQTRTFLQVTMHDLAMNVMGSAIYGDEWNQHRERILESNNWRDYPPLMAAICARRFGKSTGAGQLAAAAMLSIPSCAVGCFAPTLRQATAIMETTWNLLCRSSMFSDFQIKRTKATQIEIIGLDDTVRSLIAYPSTHKVRIGGLFIYFVGVPSSHRKKGTSGYAALLVDGRCGRGCNCWFGRGGKHSCYPSHRVSAHLVDGLLDIDKHRQHAHEVIAMCRPDGIAPVGNCDCHLQEGDDAADFALPQ